MNIQNLLKKKLLCVKQGSSDNKVVTNDRSISISIL